MNEIDIGCMEMKRDVEKAIRIGTQSKYFVLEMVDCVMMLTPTEAFNVLPFRRMSDLKLLSLTREKWLVVRDMTERGYVMSEGRRL